MRILVTGAAGFIGSALLKSLIGDPAGPEIVAVDLAERPAWAAAGRVRWICGGVDDDAVMDAIFRGEFDLVFHLASVPGALAETDPRLGRRVNLDASLDLLQRLAATSRCPRVVYASSIAVYGPSSGPVSSRTPPRPAITYGAHKRMIEIALADHVRRGEMSGISVRLPGIVARPGPATGFGSAFMSELLHALSAGRTYCCPVSPGATAWWLSVRQAVNNLIHASAIDHCGAVQVPALCLAVEDIVEGIADVYGAERASLIQYRPDVRVEATFGRFPELDVAEERALGFADDGAVVTLIRNALASANQASGGE
jgi:nucleoside-diphosphate-sugar epimerase